MNIMNENLYICLLQADNITKYKGHMKRKIYSSLGLIATLCTIMLTTNSCEVTHTYTTEISIVDIDGEAMNDVTVETSIESTQPHVVYRSAQTNDLGKVYFEFDNVAILKVNADKNNYHGEGLVVLEEDINVLKTIVVYEN